MAYICERTYKCSKCTHYRWDDERQAMCCWAMYDEPATDKLILGERYNERYGFSWDEPEKEEIYD